MSNKYAEVFDKIKREDELTKDDVVLLLGIEEYSEDYYKLLYYSNKYAREHFKRGYVFAQIGIDLQPCEIDCSFCSMAKSNFPGREIHIKSLSDVLDEAKILEEDGADEIFLMTTANFDKDEFLKYAKAVREELSSATRLIANVGDFDEDYAEKLKKAGVDGAYHICRLREGIDTKATKDQRLNTINAIIDSGLELYYCIEPIGPEHSNEEIADEIIRARDFKIDVMAAMRRTPIKGSKLFEYGDITNTKLAKIAAVTLLTVKPERSMNVHEISELSFIAGVNQLYAEVGSNPRDVAEDTKDNRGFTVSKARKMLTDNGWK